MCSSALSKTVAAFKLTSPTVAPRRADTCLSDVMGSGPPSARTSRRKCSRSIPAITSGAARRMNRPLAGHPHDNVSLLLPGYQLQALGYPISGVDDEWRGGHRRYNFRWYRVAEHVLKSKQMCADDNGREYEWRAAAARAQGFDCADACRGREPTAAAVSGLSAAHRPAIFHTGL